MTERPPKPRKSVRPTYLCGDDPRATKRERRAVRRALIALIEERLRSRRCYWTWPFGHEWGSAGVTITMAATETSRVSRCQSCGRPYSWRSFNFYDLFRFATDEAHIDEDDHALAELSERWRRFA